MSMEIELVERMKKGELPKESKITSTSYDSECRCGGSCGCSVGCAYGDRGNNILQEYLSMEDLPQTEEDLLPIGQ